MEDVALDQRGRAESHIILHTRERGPIQNLQNQQLTHFYLSQADDDIEKYGFGKPQKRCECTGFYNCHGLVFASRRTTIWLPTEIHRILSDDKYTEIPRSSVLPGDVIIYYSGGDPEHSGIVIATDGIAFRVLSKWGLGYEVLHWEAQCPYDASSTKFYRVTK